MPHEFDSLPALPNAPLRMTQDEAYAVIRLWQQEQMDSPQSALPTPSDIAEGLGIGTEDAVRLLSQVRSEREAARQAVLAARQEELNRAEAAARLAEAHARQAEAEAREVRAQSDALLAQHDRSHEYRFSKYAQEPPISPPTPEELQAAAKHEIKVRVWEHRWARLAWIVLGAVLAISVIRTILHQ